MGNANCSSDCLATRPGAVDCFQSASPAIKMYGGTAQEIYQEWEQIQG